MPETPHDRQVAIETRNAWREARDKSKPGSKEWQEFDRKYREADAAVQNLGKG